MGDRRETDAARATWEAPEGRVIPAWRWLPAAMAGWAVVQFVVFARFGKDLGFDSDRGFGFALFVVTTGSMLLLGAYTFLAIRHAQASRGEERGAWGLAAGLVLFALPVALFYYAVPDHGNTDYVCHRWGFVPGSVADAIGEMMPMLYVPVVGLAFTILAGVFLLRTTTRRPGIWLLAAVLLAASMTMTGGILHINSCSE